MVACLKSVRYALRLLAVLAAGYWLPVTGVRALEELPDEELADLGGEGLPFAWTDFRFLMSPTSYIEQVGSDLTDTASCAASAPAEPTGCRRRGDLRWYGLSVSADGTAVGVAADAAPRNVKWTVDGSGNMSQCTVVQTTGLGCPRGGPIAEFATHDNPYVLRVTDYAGDADPSPLIYPATRFAVGNGIVTYEGNRKPSQWVPGTASNEDNGGSRQAVLEWLAPTKQPDYRFSFWGEIESGRDLTSGPGRGLLKSQTVVIGSATGISGNGVAGVPGNVPAGSALRFFKFTQGWRAPGVSDWSGLNGVSGCTNAGCPGENASTVAYDNQTLGITYDSYLKGSFRFTVAQTEATPVIGVPVDFHEREGLYFRNVRAFFPLGQMFYQAITLDVPRNPVTNAPIVDGNFTIQMPLIPNRTAVYTRFYSLLTSGMGVAATAVPSPWDYGYATARSALLSQVPGANLTGYPAVNPNYWKTHGYSRWGDWFPCQGVGCPNPPTTAPAARNDLSGSDGISFVSTTSFEAFAYRIESLDVRGGDRLGYGGTSIRDYGNYGGCNAAASGNDRWLCGYGGSYAGGSSAANSASPMVHPAHIYLLDNVGGGPVAATRTVVPRGAGSTTNIGDARVEGMQINLLRLTSLGAQF